MSVDYSKYLSDIEEVIEEARNGHMFILIDDEDRENEGDLVVPAQMATPEAINFMAMHGRGLICLALTRERVVAKRRPAVIITSNNEKELPDAFLRRCFFHYIRFPDDATMARMSPRCSTT